MTSPSNAINASMTSMGHFHMLQQVRHKKRDFGKSVL